MDIEVSNRDASKEKIDEQNETFPTNRNSEKIEILKKIYSIFPKPKTTPTTAKRAHNCTKLCKHRPSKKTNSFMH